MRQSSATWWSYVAAGPLMLGYGVIRWVQGLGGPRGPGGEWVTGHSLFLASQVLMSVVILDLARRTAHRRGDRWGLVRGLGWLGWVSKLAGIAQTVIDIVVGLLARDQADMDRLYARVSSVPGVTPVVYGVGPVIFFLAIVVLAALHAVATRTGAAIAAAALLVVTVLIGGHLDLLPISSFLITAAFWLLRPDAQRLDESRGASPAPADPVSI